MLNITYTYYKQIGGLQMTNNLETLIQYQANGDGGYILSQNYDRRLMEVYGILIIDFPNITKRHTHRDHKNRLYKALADAYKVKFADVKELGICSRNVREEELVKEVK